MSELKKCAEIALTDCLNLRRQEQLLIICDETNYEIGRAFYDAGGSKCKETVMFMLQSRQYDGNELPGFVESIMSQFDVVVIPTSKSFDRSLISREANLGIRVATLPGITNESFLRTIKTDWRKLGVYTRKIAGKLGNVQKVTLKTDAGTNLVFNIDGKIRADDGRLMSRGTFGDLPAGEALIIPVENSAEGVLVIDASFSLVEGLLDVPLVLTIKDGKVIKSEGNNCSIELEKIFVKFHNQSRTLAEVGIGTHDAAVLTGNLLEDKKVRGTVHVGIGTLLSNDSDSKSIYFDGVIRKPSIWLDDKLFIDHGETL